MYKKVMKIFLSLTIVMGLFFTQGVNVYASSQEDINTIKERLKSYFLELDTIDDGSKVETCYVSKAEDYLRLIKDDGSFDDVDYQAHNNAANGAAWSPYLAIDRLQAIAIAYHKPGNTLYQSQAAVEGLEKAIKNWVTHCTRNNKPAGPYSTNWWENEVGVQLRFSRIGLFMDGVEGFSTESMNIILTKLIEKTPIKYGPGQNNLWFDQNHVYYALLKNDEAKLKTMVTEYLDYCLSAQLDDKTAEAVQVDNSFYMHGKQFYSNGYGMSMFRDMSFWIYMLRNTEFSISQEVVNRMGNYMLDGTSWTMRGDLQELYLGYRPYKFDVGYQNYAEEYIEPLKRMIVSDTKRASEYQIVLDNIQGKRNDNGKNGNYYMWRSAYSSQMNKDYGLNVKMDSKDIIGGEWRGSWKADAPKKGNLIYWTSSASSTITIDGNEYKSVYPTYDWAHTPGATTPNRVPEDYANSGRLTNGSNHTIGLSNGKYGSTAYVMNKKDTQATKGYFMFGNEIVALGAGVNSKDNTEIHTTLNQSRAKNVVVDGQNVPTGTKAKSYTGKWIHNDKIGYVFPESTTFNVSNSLQKDTASLWGEDEKKKTPETFTAWINHGVKPSDKGYQYILLPNKSASEVEEYSKDIPVTVVSNTKDIQAVRHDGLKLTQINFYKAGSLEYKPGYTITVDQPCNIMIDESTQERKITVAVTDNEVHKAINIGLSYENTKSSTTFVSQAAPYAGQSITLTEGQDDRFLSSSYTPNHPPKNVLDGKIDTYWESQTNKEEWLSVYTNSNQFIKSLDITWGDNYAKEYDIYTSQNGIDYEKVSSVKDGKGKVETVQVSKICPYIKVVMKSSQSSNYQIKEIKFNEGELISLNKPTETSSVSANASSFVGSFAVDGDLGTRWASLRNSDDEWITIDLQGAAQIDAIEINWENACSENYDIEVSNDIKTWTKVAEKLKTDISLKDIINFKTPIDSKYVRIHSHKSKNIDGKNYGINIFEINVYGKVS